MTSAGSTSRMTFTAMSSRDTLNHSCHIGIIKGPSGGLRYVKRYTCVTSNAANYKGFFTQVNAVHSVVKMTINDDNC